MRWKHLAACVLLAAAGGLALGALTASKPGRPVAVEAVLKALDRDDAGALASALSAAGSPDDHASPWREELAVATAISKGDRDALWRIGNGPRGAAAANALLHLAEHGRSADEQAKARERFRADYPSSWVLSAPVSRAPGAPR